MAWKPEFQKSCIFVPMKDIKDIEKNKLEHIKIIYDSDEKILDFLCDLIDRSIISSLQEFINDAKDQPGVFISNCPFDSLVVLILHNSPFDFNSDDNSLVLYVHNDLRGLIEYFKRQLGNTPQEHKFYSALDDITRLLYWQWVVEEERNTQMDYLG